MANKTVVILGASEKSQRFSYKAQVKLQQQGYPIIPISKRVASINGIACVKQLSDIQTAVDTVTLYVNAELVLRELPALLKLNPKRVIFNPGTESHDAQRTLQQHGIQMVEACTLIMLDEGVF